MQLSKQKICQTINTHKGFFSKILLFINLFLLLAAIILISTPSVLAQPKPKPNVDCSDTRPQEIGPLDFGGDEYHSLRPYQASPCDPDISEYKLYCGNDIVPVEKFNVSPGEATSCVPKADGGQTCKYEYKGRKIDIDMDFTNSELPIIGNTQMVPNSDSKDDLLDSAQRVNNYVSWYLNGVNYRAEEPFLSTEKKKLFGFLPVSTDVLEGEDYKDRYQDPDEPYKSHDRLVNFSGPINKLLPRFIQTDLRQTQVEDFAGGEGPIEDARHNQVAACTLGKKISIPFVSDLELLGIPIPCYYALSVGNIDILDFINARELRRLKDWEGDKTTPPVELSEKVDPDGYEEYADYWVAYKRWRGDSCFAMEIPDIIPIIGGLDFFLCGDNPGKPNFWANLYPYIPYTSTEDRKGDVAVAMPEIDPAGQLNPPFALSMQPTKAEGNDATITDIKFEPKNQRDLLYFPHMKETTQLASNLQDTFVPQGEPSFVGGGEGDKNAPIGTAAFMPYTTYRCDLKDVRWNQGDDLFGEWEANTKNSAGEDDPKGPISGTITYDAEFTCDFGPPKLDQERYLSCLDRGETPENCINESTSYDNTCEKDVMTAVSVYTRTPLADEVWDRLVAGNMSIFKKIYPQLGKAGMWDEIKDLPGVTTANYSSSADETLAGDPRSNRPGGSAEIFIPHLGGILEYFLYGIQDALRPRDAASSFPPGAPTGVAPPSGSCGAGSGYCDPDWLRGNASCLANDPTRALNASTICQAESSSNEMVINDGCLRCDDSVDNDKDGLIDLDDPDCDSNNFSWGSGAATTDYSVGLFQINLHPLTGRCPDAWADYPDDITSDQKRIWCRVGDQAALNTCVANYQNPMNNIDYMCTLSNGGTRFGVHWGGTAGYCGVY